MSEFEQYITMRNQNEFFIEFQIEKLILYVVIDVRTGVGLMSPYDSPEVFERV